MKNRKNSDDSGIDPFYDTAKSKKDGIPSTTFRIGAVCLAFLILGYQASLFVHRAAVLSIIARRSGTEASRDGSGSDGEYRIESPDGNGGAQNTLPEAAKEMRHEESAASGPGRDVSSKEMRHEEIARRVEEKYAPRRVESFRFDPNTASAEQLQRLGFSEKQAEAICSYRQKGGRFRRKSDFAKSYVVADSVYRRLERFIDIPLVDINSADSAAFDGLPGIGGYFASRMVAYREELGGYSCPEQLLEIRNFGQERLAGLYDLICCSPPAPFGLWHLPEDSLRRHPAIRSWQTARSIVLFRENNPADSLTVGALERAGVLTDEQALRLSRCSIAPPAQTVHPG